MILIVGSVMSAVAQARLGDTYEQAQARYGLEKKDTAAAYRTRLLEGSREILFEYSGWRIRCALLRATDGREYVVREEYTKIWNSEVLKAGGSPTIRDYEFQAVLTGEAAGGSWKPKRIAPVGNTLASTLGNQLALSSGLSGNALVREDGASACRQFGGSAIILNLPQAIKYENELKAQKEAKARATVPKF